MRTDWKEYGALYWAGNSLHIEKNTDAIVLVLAADHLIKQEKEFRNILQKAVAIAEQGRDVVTIGITPNRPETNYGYIKKAKETQAGNTFSVEKFVEKLNLETAIQYLQNSNYLWNSGIFIWKASTIMVLLKQHLPDVYQHIKKISDGIGSEQETEIIKEEFSSMRAVSVDYGIMEHASDVSVVHGDFDWDDVGSWLAMERIKDKDSDGNVISGNVAAIETKTNSKREKYWTMATACLYG